MTIQEFVTNYNDKKFMNTRQGLDERTEYLRNELGIKTYIPFREKRKIAEMVVARNIKEVDGIKKYDSIDGYVGFVVASIAAHTNLEWSTDPVADYDLLAESGLLTQIITEFKNSHDEIEILLKMCLASELEDNNVNVLVGHFLDKILKQIDGFSDVFKDKIENINLKDILGADLNKEDLAKLFSLLDKIK
jgi:hypothetical protein